MDNINESIGLKIKIFREKMGWTQAYLAEKAGVAQSSISSAENSQNDTHIYVDTLLRIARAFDIPITYFFQSYNDPDLSEDNYEDNEFDRAEALAQSMINRNIVAAFYPAPFTAKFPSSYSPISTLLQFMVYLPLINQKLLWEFMHSFVGDYVGNERYIANQLGFLVHIIPDSPAKKYADFISNEIDHIVTGGSRQDSIKRIQDSTLIEEGALDAYLSVINRNASKEQVYRKLKSLFCAFDLVDTNICEIDNEACEYLKERLASELQSPSSIISL